MARLMAGDRDSLGPLVVRYHSPLLAYLYRLTGGQIALAEDLVQDTFVRMLNQRTYQPRRAFRPWLYAIATNLARDHYRSQAARRVGALDDARARDLVDNGLNPEEHAMVAAAGEDVRLAIGQLGEEYRETLILRFYQGLSLREIAEALDIPLGTVKSRLSTAIHRLQECLVEVTRQETIR
jgi:RNA polymerase sigma-70 factor (ECF subfamily)